MPLVSVHSRTLNLRRDHYFGCKRPRNLRISGRRKTDRVGCEDDINLYTYVGNDPLNRSDPKGLYECSDKTSCQTAENTRTGLTDAQKSFKKGSEAYNKLAGSLKTLAQRMTATMLKYEQCQIRGTLR